MSTTTETTPGNTALPVQVDDIKYLLAQLEARGFDLTGTRKAMNDSWNKRAFTVELAADMIKLLLDGRDMTLGQQTPVPEQRTTETPRVPDGRYAVLNNDGDYAFYRVWNGRRDTLGRRVITIVYQQISDAETRLPRETSQAILRKIAENPKEAAIAYGRELGVCGACGRTLTNAESRAAGIGPVCASKF